MMFKFVVSVAVFAAVLVGVGSSAASAVGGVQVPSTSAVPTLSSTAVPPSVLVGSGGGDCALSAGAVCDSDVDGWLDSVELVVCGSARCASGREDRDGDSVPDVVEVGVCDTPSCVDPVVDVDGDRVPDWVESVV